jgi:hypothetical protein
MPGDLFDEWYSRSVTVLVPGGTDEWGATLPGTSVEVPCRISEEVQLVRNSQGEEVASSTSVHAALSWAPTFQPDYAVEYDSPAGHRTTSVISSSMNLDDPDLEGILVRLA